MNTRADPKAMAKELNQLVEHLNDDNKLNDDQYLRLQNISRDVFALPTITQVVASLGRTLHTRVQNLNDFNHALELEIASFEERIRLGIIHRREAEARLDDVKNRHSTEVLKLVKLREETRRMSQDATQALLDQAAEREKQLEVGFELAGLVRGQAHEPEPPAQPVPPRKGFNYAAKHGLIKKRSHGGRVQYSR